MSTGPLYEMGGAHPHALARNDAMKGLATGNREGKAVEREQEILTPKCVADVVRQTFGGPIEMDPCSAESAEGPVLGDHVLARIALSGPAKGGMSGLETFWVDHTYVNPPYRDLKVWLAKSFDERAYEQVLLIPVRPNRQWWCDYMAAVSAHAYLKPLKFEGFKQAFPAPLCLAYIGSRKEEFENAVRVSGLATHISLGGI